MNELLPENQTLKSDFRKLRIILIVLTIIQISYFTTTFSQNELWLRLYSGYHSDILIWSLNLVVAGIFVWYDWMKLPTNRRNKINNTFMILFLGIIGMWLWLPNRREIEKLTEQ